MVVYGSWDQASTTTPTVVTTGGTGSDSFSLIWGPFTSGADKYGAWMLQSVGAGRTGLTVSWASSSPAFADGGADSYFGQTSSVLDQNVFLRGTGTAVASGNTPTLTSADEFAVEQNRPDDPQVTPLEPGDGVVARWRIDRLRETPGGIRSHVGGEQRAVACEKPRVDDVLVRRRGTQRVGRGSGILELAFFHQRTGS